jgi:arylsulfatase A-like enzyme
MSPIRAVFVMFLAALPCASCDSANLKRPNVLLITMDTTRSDHLSVYGYDRPTSPHLELFAKEGVRFDLAYAPSATTGPSHASIFTSMYPIAHRVVKNGLILGEELQTLAELLAMHGFQNAAIVSSFVLDAQFGYAQGFQRYDADFDPATSTMTTDKWEQFDVREGFDRRADETTRRAVHWLREERDASSPFFLFVHYFDPHTPYRPPEPYATTFARDTDDEMALAIDAYDAEIAFTDHEIGRLLAALEELHLTADTLVIVTSDHGEGLGQHGHKEHGVYIYEEAVRAVLLMRRPGQLPSGLILSEPVELLDLAPTILDLLDLPAEQTHQGRSLAESLRKQAKLDSQRPIFLYRRHYNPHIENGKIVAGEEFGIRHGSWKLILGEEEGIHELYDLTSDPMELANQRNQQTEIADRLTGLLESWKERVRRDSEGGFNIPDSDRRRLKALGYVE